MEVDLAGAGFEVAIVSLGGVVSIKGTPKYRWFTMEKPRKRWMGTGGYPYFWESPISAYVMMIF